MCIVLYVKLITGVIVFHRSNIVNWSGQVLRIHVDVLDQYIMHSIAICEYLFKCNGICTRSIVNWSGG